MMNIQVFANHLHFLGNIKKNCLNISRNTYSAAQYDQPLLQRSSQNFSCKLFAYAFHLQGNVENVNISRG